MLSEKTNELLRKYSKACIQFGAAENNSAAEARFEAEKQKAHDELVEHLKMVEQFGPNYAHAEEYRPCILCDQGIEHAKCDGG